MEPIRIECTVEGFEETWIDVAPNWTRTEYKALVDASGDTWIDTFHSKILACHIQTSGEPLTEPSEVTEEALDDCDMAVLGFLDGAMLEAVAYLRSLGFLKGRASSGGSAGKK